MVRVAKIIFKPNLQNYVIFLISCSQHLHVVKVICNELHS